MYSKYSVKNYARGTKAKRSYKRNVGEVMASMAVSAVAEGAKEIWRKGKKSKLAKQLNPNEEKPKTDREIIREMIRKAKEKHGGKLGSKRGKEGYDPRKFKNPGKLDNISPEVEDLSKEWHGREVKDYSEVEEIESFDDDVVDLGELEELGIWGVNGNLFTINFKKDRPTLVCDGEGHNLEVVGGDQELDLGQEGIEHRGKRLIPIGYIYSIVYETDKHHLEGSNGYPEPYEHYFAEEQYKKKLDPEEYKNTDDWFKELMCMGVPQKCIEKGLLPTAVYNQTDGKIMIAGGNYEVTELGIKD